MRFFYLLLLFQHFISSFAQSQNSWTQEYKPTKAFIENKGQFDQFENEFTGKIEFCADFGSTRIYFGKKGICYSFLDAKKIPKQDRQALSEKLKTKTFDYNKQWEKVIGKFHYRSDQVNMIWDDSDCDFIVPSKRQNHYHSYTYNSENGETLNINHIKGYDKITYKNVYPKIDIEYTIHPQQGVKYDVVLHPGANPNNVQMIYDRDVRVENGQTKIPTLFGDIIDHEPTTFYQRNSKKNISSHYVLKNNTVSFNLAQYDATQTVIIDPWSQTPTFPSNWDCIWEIDKDAAGNVYAIGGILPMQLIKYNNAGVLQWTFNTPYDTIGSWLGSLATTNNGQSFVCNGSSARILSLQTNGALLWSNNSPQGAGFSDEFWSIAFNCDQTKLVIGGTRLVGLNPAPRIFNMNMTNGNVINSFQVTPPPTGFGAGHEVRAITHCTNDKYYYMTHDTLGYISTNFSACGSLGASNLKYGSQHNLSYKHENFREGNSGTQALKTFGNFLFVHRGNIVEKRNFFTGAIIASVNIPGGQFINTSFLGITTRQVGCSGIDIDNCGNVYVGATNGVVKFDQNLAQLATYPTSFIVYDVHVTTGGNIIAGGSTGTSTTATRSGGIQHINANACVELTFTCCDPSICPVPNLCPNSAPVTLSVSTPGGTWSGTGVSAVGVFNPAVAGIGTHTVTYTLACGSESQTIIVSPCLPLAVCIESNGTYTAQNGVAPYTWQSQTTTQNCSACLFGCNLPPGCAVNVQTWTTYNTGTNVPPPTAFPIRLLDNTGATLIITNASQLALCASNPCPPLVSNSNITQITCNGLNNGSASISTTGGSAPYTYNWTNGPLTLNGMTQNNLAPGTYSINIVDAANCPGSATLTITQPTALVLQLVNVVPSNCGGPNGQAVVSASGGTGGYLYSWSPIGGVNATANNLNAGNYTVTVQDANTCSTSLLINIANSTAPIITDVSIVNPTCLNPNGGQIGIIANGGSAPLTYQIGNGTPQTSNVFANLSSGAYTINVQDANGCSITTNANLSNTTSPVISNLQVQNTTCLSPNSGQIIVSASGGNGSINYQLNNGTPQSSNVFSNLTAGNYTITVQDQSSCSATQNTTITAAVNPSITSLIVVDPTCSNPNSGQITVQASSSSASMTYQLNNGTPQSSNVFSNLVAGNYTVTLQEGTCTATGNVVIPAATGLSITNLIVVDPTCSNPNSGQITVQASSSSASMTYQLNNGTPQSSNVFSNLAAGNYTVTLQEGTCIESALAIVELPQPPSVSQGNIVPAQCGSNNGSATVIVNSGSGNYTFSWSSSAITGSTAANLAPGSYAVTVSDNVTGCEQSITVNIPAVGGPNLNLLSTSTSCYGLSNGTVLATATGGSAPYSYSLNNGISQTSGVFNNLAAGTYQITVSDANNCTSSQQALVNAPTQLIATTMADDSICVGQSIMLSGLGLGGTGTLNFSWNQELLGATPTVSPSSTTTYLFTVTDDNGCIATDEITINIVADPIASFSISNTILSILEPSISLQNNSLNFTTQLWNFGDGSGTTQEYNPTHTYADTAAYYYITLYVTNNHGCIDSITKLVVVENEVIYYVPNTFTPDPDQFNPVFKPIFTTGFDIYNYKLLIFNRWGEVIFESNNAAYGWDGTYGGKICQDGIYTWNIIFKELKKDKRYNITGHVNLLR